MSEHSELGALASKTNYGRKVPDFCGRLYTDDQPNGAAGTWVRRAEVDALLDEIAMLRRRLETRELNDLVQKHCSDETCEPLRPPQRYRVQQDKGEYALKGCADGDLVDYSAYEALLRRFNQPPAQKAGAGE